LIRNDAMNQCHDGSESDADLSLSLSLSLSQQIEKFMLQTTIQTIHQFQYEARGGVVLQVICTAYSSKAQKRSTTQNRTS
jgi:hypothetical protein